MKLLLKIILVTLITLVTCYGDCLPRAAGQEYYSRPQFLVASLAGLNDLYINEYKSSKRLRNRFYFSDQNEVMAIKNNERFKIEKDFIKNILGQIRFALEKNLVDKVMYSDMGHGHILVPKDEFHKSKHISEYLMSKNIKILYHTAELFDFNQRAFPHHEIPRDPWLRARYETRNLLSHNLENKALEVLTKVESSFNTVRGIPGYQQVGTLYFVPNVNGCFQVEGAEFKVNLDFAFSI